jgi:hypothetical protein
MEFLDDISGASSSDKKAKKYLNQSLDEWGNVKAPSISPVDLEGYDWLGDLGAQHVNAGADVGYNDITSNLAEFAEAGPSAMEGVKTDPRLQENQMASLSALEDIYKSGGLTAADQANLSKIQTQAQTADRGRRGAIQQAMASRGMGGSGMDLLAQLQSSQGATEQQAQQGLDVAGMAQDRALNAMLQSGELSGSIRGQQFGEQSQVAGARDAINKFNAQNRNQSNQFNAGALNDTAQFNAGNNLRTDMYNRDTRIGTDTTNANFSQDAAKYNNAGRQGTANQGVDTRNQETMTNKVQLPQQNFQNQVTVAGGKSGAAGQAMNYYGQQAAGKRDQFGNIIAGGAKVGAAFV